MKKFTLPPVSPLIGAKLSVYRTVLRGKKIDKKNYLKVTLTYIIGLITSLFHWLDAIYFKAKIQKKTNSGPPLFIIGHWRSGTTFLHNLLTLDRNFGYVTTYHAVFPNNLRSKWVFKTFMKIFMPKERPGDQLRLEANFPQEDEYAISNLTHMAYYHSFYFPKHYNSYYNDWIRFQNISTKDKQLWKSIYQRMVAQALINTGGSRAILKNPANTGRIDTLLEIWPDAQFIFIVRNPIVVYLSTKKFFSQLYPTVEFEKISTAEISEMVFDVYTKLMHDYLALKERIPTKNLVELRYEDFIEQPQEILEGVYTKFAMPDFEKVKPTFEQFIISQKSHKLRPYSITRAELDRISKRLDFAMKHWNYTVPENLTVNESENKFS